MNECPDHERTLAWLYGHGSEDQLHHVVDCEACQALVDEHERVAAAVASVAPALRTPGAVAPAPRTDRRARPGWGAGLWAAGLLLAAAVALLAIGARPDGGGSETAAPATAEVGATPVATEWDELDLALDDLDAEVEALADNLDTL